MQQFTFLCCPFEKKRRYIAIALSVRSSVSHQNLMLALTLPFLNIFSSNSQNSISYDNTNTIIPNRHQGQGRICKSFAGFSLTHRFVRFGACIRQMTRKMNLHCDTLDAHNACLNELFHRHILLSPTTFIFVSSSNCCKKLLSINLLQSDKVFCK